MERSYLTLKKKEIVNESVDKLLKSDSVVIDIEDLELVLEENIVQKLNKLKKVYVKIDSACSKRHIALLRKLDKINYAGIAIINANVKVLNQLNIACREIESVQKKAYGTLVYLPFIDNLIGLKEIEKIVKYRRVRSVVYDRVALAYELNVSDVQTKELEYYFSNVIMSCRLENKEIVDGVTFQSDFLNSLNSVYNLGVRAKLSDKLEEIEMINAKFTPSESDVKNAKIIVGTFNEDEKLRKKNTYIDGKLVTRNKALQSYQLLDNCVNLGLIAENELPNINIKQRKKVNDMKFYTLGEEIGNAISHGVGIILGIVAVILFSYFGSSRDDSTFKIGGIIFGVAVILLYSMSTLYHCLPLGSQVKRIFKRFDHATIYFLIAGSYTPFLLLVVQKPLSLYLVGGMWVLALIGAFLKSVWIKKFEKIHLINYLALGWIPAIFLVVNLSSMSSMALLFLILGGLSYTLGVFFYASKLFKFTHFVWHIFVFLGTLFHFLGVLLYL